jgi:predicted porin
MKKLFLFASIFFICGIHLMNAQGKFSGYMFGDYYYNIMRDNGSLSNSASSSAAPGTTAMQAFQFRRIYFTYDNDISESFTSRFRLEVDQSANASNGKIGSFVKDAYLRWKNIFSGSDLFFGIHPTPAYEISEAAWGYRSLEKTIMDLRGIVSSRDFGISLKGKLTGDGMLNYWVMLANNSGNSPETDKYKRYYVHLQLKPITNLQATLYADYKDVANVAAGNNGTWTTALFVGYAEPSIYNINVEAFMVTQSNVFTPTGGSIGSKNGLGISLFGSYNITPELAVVGRYDYFDPNANSAANAKGDIRNYVIAGLSWKVDKNVSIMPNLLYETYEAPAGHGEPDPSVTARVTLYYVFL